MGLTSRPLPTANVQRVRRRLLAHYDRTARDLPWRRTSDPYAIWISEVMLQQTRVETARVRWPLFLARFPDVERLAAAREGAVLKAWEGLGYYSRARNLRRAARAIVTAHRARLPDRAVELRNLAGFGPYTAAAVASIAFGERVAVVDGNVRRVLARFLAEDGDPTREPARSRIQAVADRLVPPSRPGDWNQALMELGATLCRPRSPRCEACPLRGDCVGRARGNAAHLPTRRPRPRVPHDDLAAALIRRGSRVLVVRRPSEGLLGGLWELPTATVARGEAHEDACVRGVREATGLDARVTEALGSLAHAYTHLRITLHVFGGRAPRGRPRPLACASARFVERRALERLAFARAHRRALDTWA